MATLASAKAYSEVKTLFFYSVELFDFHAQKFVIQQVETPNASPLIHYVFHDNLTLSRYLIVAFLSGKVVCSYRHLV